MPRSEMQREINSVLINASGFHFRKIKPFIIYHVNGVYSMRSFHFCMQFSRVFYAKEEEGGKRFSQARIISHSRKLYLNK